MTIRATNISGENNWQKQHHGSQGEGEGVWGREGEEREAVGEAEG